LQTNLHCRVAIPKWIAISQFQFQKIKWHAFLYIVQNFGKIPSSNARVNAVKRQFSPQYNKNRNITPNISEHPTSKLILTNFSGRHIVGDDYPNIRLAVAQGTLLWQPDKI